MFAETQRVADRLGVNAAEARLVAACDVADRRLVDYLGATRAAELAADPPETLIEAATGVAVDVYRRPTSPGGYYQLGDYVGRLARDPLESWLELVAPFRTEWPIA